MSVRTFAQKVKASFLPPLPIDLGANIVPVNWDKPFDTLREKWKEVPSGPLERAYTADMIGMADDEFLKYYLDLRTKASVWEDRGWYQELYKDTFRGKKVLDIGCGMGFDTTFYAQHGANVTFVDLAQTNLDVVKRACKLLNVEAGGFIQLVDVNSLEALADDFDVIMAIGSLHNAPQSVMKPECAELLKHLKIGGRWIQFTYPKIRWERDGSPPFELWGVFTDGERTPYCEWYDTEKLLNLLSPATFDVLFYYEWNKEAFNWFDFKRTG